MYNRFTYRFMTKTEQQNIVIQPMKKPAVMQHFLERASALRFRTMILLFIPYLLAGCAETTGNDELSTIAQAIMPEQRVTDYRLKGCDVIWDIVKPAAMENGLYWLKVMDCTDRLSSLEARDTAKRFTPTVPTDWGHVFKQSILMSRATPTLIERRKIVENLNRYSPQFPSALRPLLQLWREQQYLKINLAEERLKFQRLQFDSDSKIDRLKEIRARLEHDLRSISRKLENLTDIERQLSSRKQDQSSVATSGETEHLGHVEASEQLKPEAKPEMNQKTEAEANLPEEKGAE
ncbi:two-component system QseEF-associated lipoprotein QseG [Xenorhabdus sp. XENO-7]|uniref:Two-component system QseEF-associated lipoprotein QseG n=1 Tax=Xenorhabdus aichiensis TaxID=3025874 RepID=A0ABT5M6B2_9GAMM|nr:two-component system QseEF-associated lipoprotein QseG [Xenorhabdus aichiensis]MDC9622495.1 two-component system QseEF-associated lipoprotein QseG [Xenorhabdus aichiensis]